jgi:hypothetical protein
LTVTAKDPTINRTFAAMKPGAGTMPC